MAYADGFLIPVPTKNLAAYRKLSQKAGEVWMEHGALDYKECVGDDIDHKGTVMSFAKTLNLPKGHSVVFSWIVYASKTERDRINKKVMADPRLEAMVMGKDSPFDHKQMRYGGFEVIVDMAPNAAPKRAKTAAKKKAPAKKKKAKR
jgi:uncharacterized protein YbaA (DUF1428 family)